MLRPRECSHGGAPVGAWEWIRAHGCGGAVLRERSLMQRASGLSCNVESTWDISIVWTNWNGGSYSRFLTRLLTGGEDRRLRACVYAKEGHFEYSLWTDNVDFAHYATVNVTCLTVASLIMKLCQQRWRLHSCSFYKVYSALTDLGFGGRFWVCLVAVNVCLQQCKGLLKSDNICQSYAQI